MDNSVHEQGSHIQQDPKNLLERLPILGNLIKWLAGLIEFTEEELQKAGIYLGRLGGE
jgi:hypothetical protein